MPFTSSERGQFVDVVPTGPTTPTVPAHLQGLVDAIETHTNMRVATWDDAATFIAPYSPGMVLFVEEEEALFLRLTDRWEKLHPKNYTGTGTPPPELGDDGDLYVQTS